MAANKNYKNPTAFIAYTKALKKTGQFFYMHHVNETTCWNENDSGTKLTNGTVLFMYDINIHDGWLSIITNEYSKSAHQAAILGYPATKGPIYKISYDNLTIMPKLRSTCDWRNSKMKHRRNSKIYKHLTKDARLFLGMIHSQNCKVVWNSVCKLAYDIPESNFRTF